MLCRYCKMHPADQEVLITMHLKLVLILSTNLDLLKPSLHEQLLYGNLLCGNFNFICQCRWEILDNFTILQSCYIKIGPDITCTLWKWANRWLWGRIGRWYETNHALSYWIMLLPYTLLNNITDQEFNVLPLIYRKK